MKKIVILLILGMFLAFASNSAHALNCTTDVTPGANNCEGPISGNDSQSAVNSYNLGAGLFNYNDWVFLQKEDTPGGLDTNIDVGLDVTPNGGASSGNWSVDTGSLIGIYEAVMLVLKAGPNFVAYLYEPPIEEGLWTTAALNNKDLSHLSLYARGTPIPEPATMLLLGFGLIGVAAFGRKRLIKK